MSTPYLPFDAQCRRSGGCRRFNLGQFREHSYLTIADDHRKPLIRYGAIEGALR